MKCGMTQLWDTWGRKRVCTVLEVDDCAVTQVKLAGDNADRRKVHTVQVGGGTIKAKRVSKPLLGHFRKADVAPKRRCVSLALESHSRIIDHNHQTVCNLCASGWQSFRYPRMPSRPWVPSLLRAISGRGRGLIFRARVKGRCLRES